MPARTILRIAALLGALALTGCGSQPVGTPAGDVTAAATSTPVPTDRSTPDATATVAGPSPDTGSGGPYADALVAALAADPLVTHVEQSATVVATVGGSEVTVTATMTGDISGRDLALVLTIAQGGIENVQELTVVGDSAYVRENGAWQSGPRAVVEGSLDGLIGNLRVVGSAADLRHVGLESVDGRELHRLTAVRPVPYAPSTGGTGRYDTLDIWIEEDGTPVLIRGAFSVTDAAGAQGSGTSEMRFSAFGGPIEISAPSLEPSPGT